MIPVVPHERVDCLASAEEGEIPCEETGLCMKHIITDDLGFRPIDNFFSQLLDIVEFDNNYSYIKWKKILYAINVEAATGAGNALD